MGKESSKTKYCIFLNEAILVYKTIDGIYALPTELPKELSRYCDDVVDLGLLGNCCCMAVEVPNVNCSQVTDGFEVNWLPLKQSFELLDDVWFQVIVKAFQIIRWDKQHQYCGKCGGSTRKQEGVFERYCTGCQLSFFPKISPSIIVMIHKEDKILMARSANFPPNCYALIAGFVDPGETLEEAVHREVKEEVGVSIDNVCYFGSQPWPFPDSLMVGFTADYVGGEIVFHDGEIESGGWYDKDHLPGMPSSSISIASLLIESFRAR